MRNWYPPDDCDLLRKLAKIGAAAAKNSRAYVIEVGCWDVQSTLILLEAFRPHVVNCVDRWSVERKDDNGRNGADAFQDFLRNTRDYDNVRLRIMRWQNFFDTIQPKRIAFIHINGDHRYTEVAGSIHVALPRMIEGGILCGHNYAHPDWPDVKRAVDELLPQREVEGNVWWVQKQKRPRISPRAL